MPIEKAFAIRAEAHEIYVALERDIDAAVRAGDGGHQFEVLRKEPDHELELRVTISGFPCWLTYRLDPKPDHTEVVALLTPFGFRYVFFRLITFGLRDEGLALALVQGLVNLKAAVEGPEEDAEPHALPDEDASAGEP
jgi:hypothetical protein